MPELYLQRSNASLMVSLGEYSDTIPFADVAIHEQTWQHIYDDAADYGNKLFAKTFRRDDLRNMLTGMSSNERLVLVADDPLVAAIPWEYLRDMQDKLLAGHLNLVRGLPESQLRDAFTLTDPLEIVAIPVSPVDEERVLNVEREWRNLVETVTKSHRTLTAKRVRPPSLSQMERTLSRRGTTIVHFIGHSTTYNGKGLLAFEDARAHSQLIDAADFADALDDRVFLVVLNSCLSAVVAKTEFGNIAQSLVNRGIPYALGMQFVLAEDAALTLSQALYDFLLQGRDVEEAVRRIRRTLENTTTLHNPNWAAGIPVLYTSLHRPAAPLNLRIGQASIQPDPELLQQSCDLAALPLATHFQGRKKEMSEVFDALLSPQAQGFVLLHGLGGIGKTALARAVAEHLCWYYQDRALAVSFETFVATDAQRRTSVNQQFADRFYNQLAHFYGLNPASYNTTADLQRAILQRRMHLRSLLILDNVETLIDAQKEDNPAAKAFAAFISRLKEGDGAVLLTSRSVPPPDWGDRKIINVSSLADDAGGSLFLALLSPDRRAAALPAMHRELSRRVKGHPLSIRLLAGRFAEATVDLETFLKDTDAELKAAEQATPTSLEDPERHETLYACLDYSIRRLTPEQRRILDAVSLFQTPFLPEFAAFLLDDADQTLLQLQHLLRLGLLEFGTRSRTIQDRELELLEMHSMVRWYIRYYLHEPDPAVQERYGEVYRRLARQVYEEQGIDSRFWYLLRQSLTDCEAALNYLPPAGRGSLAYFLARSYDRLGQPKRALELYELTLEIYQDLGNAHAVAVSQTAMAELLSQQGKPQEALVLYKKSFAILQELGDVREVAVTQTAMADLLKRQGKPQEALALYEQALTSGKLSDVRVVAGTQTAMADLLSQQGKPQEALALYEQSLSISQELGDVHEVAATQQAMGIVLSEQGKLQEALALYEQALSASQKLGDVRAVAATQRAMGFVLSEQGKSQEAVVLYEQALAVFRELGDVHGVAMTQSNLCQLLFLQEKPQPALKMAWEAYTALKEHRFMHDAEGMRQLLILIKKNLLEPAQFDAYWTEVIAEPQPDWLHIAKVHPLPEQPHLSVEELQRIGSYTINVLTDIPERRNEWREDIQWELQEAQRIGRPLDAELFAAVLALLDDQVPPPVGYHPYAALIALIQEQIVAGEKQPSSTYSEEVVQAVRDFLSAKNWNTTRQVVETRQEMLFQPEAERILEQNIAAYRAAGDAPTITHLERRLALLRTCKASGIEKAFANLQQAGTATLPFDFDLIPRSIRALLGSPQEKMNHIQYLATLAQETTDEDLKALINTVQMALVGGDPSQLGRNLQGLYRAAWETIAANVEAGRMGPHFFETIAKNTLAVLGPASSRRSEWRANAVEMRNQATMQGNRNLAALLDAVIGLLDAGGKPEGLGQALNGIYAKTWHAILQHLPT